MVPLEVKTLGMKAMSRGFTRYANEVKDWRPAFESIWSNYRDIVRRNFAGEGYPSKWPPLSPAYQAWKDAHGGAGKPILVFTSRMKNSLLGVSQANAQDTIKEIKKLNAEFGTTLARARGHQFGNSAKNLPVRAVLQFTDQHISFWARIIHEHAYNMFDKSIPDGPR